MDLEGKVVFITGANAGIGEAFAYQAAERGAKGVTLFARRKEELERVAAAVGTINGGATEAMPIAGSITNFNEVDIALEKTIETYGQLDVVVNNAGMIALAPFASTGLDRWRNMVDVNLTGQITVTHAAITRGLSEGVIFVNSHVGLVPNEGNVLEGNVVYAATKAGMHAMARYLQPEHPNLKFVSVYPAGVDTPGLHAKGAVAQELFDPGEIEKLSPKVIAAAGYDLLRDYDPKSPKTGMVLRMEGGDVVREPVR